MSIFSRSNFKFKTPAQKKHISLQISAQDVAVTQAFLEGIDSLFETITGFIDLVNGNTQYDDEYLLNMNEIVIQSLNTFGVTCKNYKSDKRLMAIGKEQVNQKWSKLGNAYQQTKQYPLYVKYMKQALAGKNMKLYPLIKRSEKQKATDFNDKTVNEAMGQMIGGNCRVNQRNTEVRKDFINYDKRHEAMYKQGNKSSHNNKNLVSTPQASPNEMIGVPVNKSTIQFEPEQTRSNGRKMRNNNSKGCCNHSHNTHHSHNSHNSHNEYKQQESIINTRNTYLVKDLLVKNNVTISAETPVLILRDHGRVKDIQISDPNKKVLNKVPIEFMCAPSKIQQIRQAEMNHIMSNGSLGYASILDFNQEQMASQQHKDSIANVFYG